MREPDGMNLLDIVTLDTIRVPLQAREKRAAIDELVDVLAAAGKVEDAPGLKTAVWTRESTRSTGIGHALAIPHGKSEGVADLAMAIGKPSEPIDFNAVDGQPVRLVVMLASPMDRTADHIQALARISRLMSSEDFRTKVYNAESAERIYELLQQQESAGAAR
ncbi:MAG: PTS sugar transporter subunit IIA [Phycisphaerales bacterium]